MSKEVDETYEAYMADIGYDNLGKNREPRSISKTDQELIEKIANVFYYRIYPDSKNTRGENTGLSMSERTILYRKEIDQILADIKRDGFIKPPKSMELTELAEILYNFLVEKKLDIPRIKETIQSFLLANHYVKLADDQSLPKVIRDAVIMTDFEEGLYKMGQHDMLKAGWRKVIL